MRLPKLALIRHRPKGDEQAAAGSVVHPITRLLCELERGATMEAASRRAGLRPEIGAVMVDYLQRSGKLTQAGSLCSSGLGACGAGTSDSSEQRVQTLAPVGEGESGETKRTMALHCAGCPMAR